MSRKKMEDYIRDAFSDLVVPKINEINELVIPKMNEMEKEIRDFREEMHERLVRIENYTKGSDDPPGTSTGTETPDP